MMVSLADPSIGCVALNVDPFLGDVGNFDANLYRSYESSTDKRLLSFVGKLQCTESCGATCHIEMRATQRHCWATIRVA